jgi:hypothetical protein
MAATHPYEKWAKELGIDLNASYDGVRLMEMKEGKFEATEHRAPGKMYTEINVSNMRSGIILREDLNKSYLLMPSMGFYKEDSLEGGLMQAANGMKFSQIEKVGKEDVIGFAATKYKTRFTDNEGKGAGFLWVTDGGVPIKMDMVYTGAGEKGRRITMQFTELNMRAQDPAIFELPANLKPMNFGNMGQMMNMGGAQQAPATPSSGGAAASSADLSAKQQACLEEAAARSAKAQESQKKKAGFGKLMGAVARTASRYGVSGVSKASHEVYSANATANDVSIIADELGITEAEVEDCRNPS